MKDIESICKDIRCDLMKCIAHLGVGHVGGCLSVVDVLGVLYFEEMNIDPGRPGMEGRDRLICSKGHAGPAVYATLANRGYFPKEELMTLNQGGTNLPSHCDMNRTPGIDMTTGSLGQGFSCAVGVALASKVRADGATIYTIIGDGESQEGQIWEAAMFAAHQKLDNLIGITDYNKLQIDGAVSEINDIACLDSKWAAFGWEVINVADGNDVAQIKRAIEAAKRNRGGGKPTMLILNTVKGKGVSFIEALGTANHNTTVSAEDCAKAIAEIRGE